MHSSARLLTHSPKPNPFIIHRTSTPVHFFVACHLSCPSLCASPIASLCLQGLPSRPWAPALATHCWRAWLPAIEQTATEQTATEQTAAASVELAATATTMAAQQATTTPRRTLPIASSLSSRATHMAIPATEAAAMERAQALRNCSLKPMEAPGLLLLHLVLVVIIKKAA